MDQERRGNRFYFGWSLVVAGALAFVGGFGNPWAMSTGAAVALSGAVVLILPSLCRMWVQNRWRFGRTPDSRKFGSPTAAGAGAVVSGYPSVSLAKTRELLEGLLGQCRELKFEDRGALDAFDKRGEMIIGNVYGVPSHHLRRFNSISVIRPGATVLEERRKIWTQGQTEYVNLLQTMLDELALLGEKK